MTTTLIVKEDYRCAHCYGKMNINKSFASLEEKKKINTKCSNLGSLYLLLEYFGLHLEIRWNSYRCLFGYFSFTCKLMNRIENQNKYYDITLWRKLGDFIFYFFLLFEHLLIIYLYEKQVKYTKNERRWLNCVSKLLNFFIKLCLVKWWQM